VITHPLIASIVRNRDLAYIYGPPGTGKTRIGVHVFKLARSLGLDPIFIATEAGSVIVANMLEGEARIARDAEELVEYVEEASLKEMYIIVDTINSYYREDPSFKSRKILAATLAFMRISGGLALGQVSEFSGTISSPGIRVVEKYAKVIGVTSKVEDEKFMLKIIKPWERILLFKIEEEDIKWL